MKTLVLDSEAVSQLARAKHGAALATVRTWIQAAAEIGADVVVPAAVLSERYRGGGHDQSVDAFLSRYRGIEIVDTDRVLARRIGHLLANANFGSSAHVDATVVATAIERGGAVILTSDPDDLSRLTKDNPNITIVAL